ncbi:hypothetical protein TREMEDRAFT_59568 [Tremella mesenterica DSM 1558]|uniref:uncharacterized protein n=1 Tax=Tremella mesenterica (strain ATCC 24925 / CBS 8224 / DSM 1558 / NBRC 9311 / NRRL Y-6157 / RJB 2259-6 / UBC 559-6) TaxID=578456 RepID=UPI0003F48E1F|nr:uncharacterized protein TREMEDRAFT_59568 [Tremella mesenterica DSM 1558]EIW73404.1 hypothetical protein TREMEDRAFT_59568 [Tremella mesenterica DSM 1558]
MPPNAEKPKHPPYQSGKDRSTVKPPRDAKLSSEHLKFAKYHQAKDKIWKDDNSLRSLQATLQQNIQPWWHAEPHCLPQVAKKTGLILATPKQLIEVGVKAPSTRGPLCWGADKKKGTGMGCHVGNVLSAFHYYHPQIRCSNNPPDEITLLAKFKEDGQLHSCVQCFSNTAPGHKCTIQGVNLSSLKPPEDLTTTQETPDDESEEESEQSEVEIVDLATQGRKTKPAAAVSQAEKVKARKSKAKSPSPPSASSRSPTPAKSPIKPPAKPLGAVGFGAVPLQIPQTRTAMAKASAKASKAAPKPVETPVRSQNVGPKWVTDTPSKKSRKRQHREEDAESPTASRTVRPAKRPTVSGKPAGRQSETEVSSSDVVYAGEGSHGVGVSVDVPIEIDPDSPPQNPEVDLIHESEPPEKDAHHPSPPASSSPAPAAKRPQLRFPARFPEMPFPTASQESPNSAPVVPPAKSPTSAQPTISVIPTKRPRSPEPVEEQTSLPLVTPVSAAGIRESEITTPANPVPGVRQSEVSSLHPPQMSKSISAQISSKSAELPNRSATPFTPSPLPEKRPMALTEVAAIRPAEVSQTAPPAAEVMPPREVLNPTPPNSSVPAGSAVRRQTAQSPTPVEEEDPEEWLRALSRPNPPVKTSAPRYPKERDGSPKNRQNQSNLPSGAPRRHIIPEVPPIQPGQGSETSPSLSQKPPSQRYSSQDLFVEPIVPNLSGAVPQAPTSYIKHPPAQLRDVQGCFELIQRFANSEEELTSRFETILKEHMGTMMSYYKDVTTDRRKALTRGLANAISGVSNMESQYHATLDSHEALVRERDDAIRQIADLERLHQAEVEKNNLISNDVERLTREKDGVIEKLQTEVREKSSALETMQQRWVAAKRSADGATSLEVRVREMEKQMTELKEKNAELEAKHDKAVKIVRTAVEQKNLAVQQKETAVREKDEAIREKDEAVVMANRANEDRLEMKNTVWECKNYISGPIQPDVARSSHRDIYTSPSSGWKESSLVSFSRVLTYDVRSLQTSNQYGVRGRREEVSNPITILNVAKLRQLCPETVLLPP